jgi:hypothetical protein
MVPAFQRNAGVLELDQVYSRRQDLVPLSDMSNKPNKVMTYLDLTVEQFLQLLQLCTITLVVDGFQKPRALLGGVFGSDGDAVFDGDASRAVDGVHAETCQECVHNVSAVSIMLKNHKEVDADQISDLANVLSRLLCAVK